MEPSFVLSAKGSPEKANLPGKGEQYLTLRSIVAYDDEWSADEMTERLAFSQALELLPETPSVIYFAFPWARLIDLLQSNPPDGDHLLEVLAEAKKLLGGQHAIITVCQHKNLIKYQSIFVSVGITHIFWPHVQKGQSSLPDHKHVRLCPFPSAPFSLSAPLSHLAKRSRLFSYTADGMQRLLPGQAHGQILQKLSVDPRGSVVTPPPTASLLSVDENSGRDSAPASIEASQSLQGSEFSLCPESNSSWLWTSIAGEAIPVFFEKVPLLPGNMPLWEEATVCCPASPEALLELPARLECMARDEVLLELKRRALRQLRLLYGADCFIYDILKLFVSLTGAPAENVNERPSFPYGQLHALAAQIIQGGETGLSSANVFTLGCCSRILADSSTFFAHYQEDSQFRLACQKAFVVCDGTHRELLRKALALKGLALDGCDAIVAPGETTPC